MFRRRKSGREGCNCAEGKEGSGLELPDTLEMKAPSEVYDNPNYSHIIIGGKPFFILPSGELSEHVPVPAQVEQHTPRHAPPNHIYEAGSSTYRSGSDYDTESSTYRPDSDRASNNGFPPIYEEIDKCSSTAGGGSLHHESQFNGGGGEPGRGGFVVPVQTMTVMRRDESLPPTTAVMHGGAWGHKSVSPRRPPAGARLPNRTPESSSVYYYSDTLRRGGGRGGLLDGGGREESDSGISSNRSGHNTSSESTPQPRLDLNRSLRAAGGGRNHRPAVVSSDEDLSQGAAADRHRRGGHKAADMAGHGIQPVDTQVIVRNTSRREPRSNL